MSIEILQTFCEQVSAECYFSKIRIIDRWIGSVFEMAFKECDTTPSQFNLLVAINSMGELASAKMISKYLKMEKSTVSRDLKNLSNKGLVRESASKLDARNKRLSLTSFGKKRILQCQKSWDEAQMKSKSYLAESFLKFDLAGS